MLRLRLKKSLVDSYGATLVEFTIGSFLFFGTIFGMFDIGMIFWTKSQLTNEAADVARTIGVKRVAQYSGNSCATIENFFRDEFVSYDRLHNNFIKDKRYQFRLNSLAEGRGWVMRVTVDYKCSAVLIPGGVNMSTTAEAIVEDASFSCT